MPGLGLGYNEGIVLAGELTKRFGLAARVCQCAHSRAKMLVIEVEHFVIEACEAPSGIAISRTGRQARQPGRRLAPGASGARGLTADIGPPADSTNGRNQADGSVRLNMQAPLTLLTGAEDAAEERRQASPIQLTTMSAFSQRIWASW